MTTERETGPLGAEEEARKRAYVEAAQREHPVKGGMFDLAARLFATLEAERTAPDGVRELALAALKADRVNTDTLSVESIIETYASRLMQAYPNERDEFMREKDDLLLWWAARAEPGLRLYHGDGDECTGALCLSMDEATGEHDTDVHSDDWWEGFTEHGRRAALEAHGEPRCEACARGDRSSHGQHGESQPGERT